MKDVIHEALESRRSIGKSERNNLPFIRAIMGAEGCLPLVVRRYMDEVIGVAKVDFGVVSSLSGDIEEVCEKQQWITVLPSDFVKSPIVDT